MFTRRALLISVGAVVALPKSSVAMAGEPFVSEHQKALRHIARRVTESLNISDSPMWSQLTAPWRVAPNLEKMVDEQANAVFAGGHARWLKERYGSVLFEGKLNSWLFSNILDRFPLLSSDLHDDRKTLAAFTALVPVHLR